jgi:pSer/pThr/pTyr-binding forkhead associated (FHA) protein
LPDDDISREHAALERSVDGIVVRDLASKNGVEVGGERISGQRRLRDGEIIRIGETELRVSDPEDRYLRRMEEAVGEVEAGVASQGPRSPQRPSPMPWVAAIIATTVLLLVLGLVLALVFGALN